MSTGPGAAPAAHLIGGPTESSGGAVVTGSVVATVTFTVTALAAVVVPARLGTPAAVLDLVLFVVGLAAFAAALLRAAARSRHEELSLAGLFLLSGSAPAVVRRTLLGCLAAQTVVAFAAAAFRPFTPLAFGVLVPTLGLAACGLWAALHGSFPAKTGATGAASRLGTDPAGRAMMVRPKSLPRRRRRR